MVSCCAESVLLCFMGYGTAVLSLPLFTPTFVFRCGGGSEYSVDLATAIRTVLSS